MGTDTEYPEPVVERYPLSVRIAIVVSLLIPAWFGVYMLFARIGPVPFIMLAAILVTKVISIMLERNEAKLPPGYYRFY